MHIYILVCNAVQLKFYNEKKFSDNKKTIYEELKPKKYWRLKG